MYRLCGGHLRQCLISVATRSTYKLYISATGIIVWVITIFFLIVAQVSYVRHIGTLLQR